MYQISQEQITHIMTVLAEMPAKLSFDAIVILKQLPLIEVRNKNLEMED